VQCKSNGQEEREELETIERPAQIGGDKVFHCGPLSERYHGNDSANSVLAIDHASRRSQRGIVVPTVAATTARRSSYAWSLGVSEAFASVRATIRTSSQK
jgi:hypothetical protein